MTAPTTPLADFTDGILTAAAMLNQLAQNVQDLYTSTQGGFRTRKPMCLVRVTSTGRSVPSGSDYLVPWDVEDVDTDAMFSPGGATITVQRSGVYRAGFHASIVSATGPAWGVLAGRVTVDSTSPAAAIAASTAPQGNGNSAAHSAVSCATPPLQLTAGQIIRCYVRQTSGAALNLNPANGGCRAFVQFISP